jgi:hypothetical protein
MQLCPAAMFGTSCVSGKGCYMQRSCFWCHLLCCGHTSTEASGGYAVYVLDFLAGKQNQKQGLQD